MTFWDALLSMFLSRSMSFWKHSKRCVMIVYVNRERVSVAFDQKFNCKKILALYIMNRFWLNYSFRIQANDCVHTEHNRRQTYFIISIKMWFITWPYCALCIMILLSYRRGKNSSIKTIQFLMGNFKLKSHGAACKRRKTCLFSK